MGYESTTKDDRYQGGIEFKIWKSVLKYMLGKKISNDKMLLVTFHFLQK